MELMIRFLILLTVTALCCCATPITDALKTPGKYFASHGGASDTLELHSDSTYTHVYIDPAGEKFVEDGYWDLRYNERNELSVVIRRYTPRLLSRENIPASPEEQLNWPMSVTMSWNSKVKLSLFSDLGLFYTRIEEKQKSQ